MVDFDLPKLMKALEESFQPEKAAGFTGIFQCHITGVNEEDWMLDVQNQRIRILPGKEKSPRATLELTKEDLGGLLSGTLDPMRAYFSGKIQLHGDLSGVMKLIGMFEFKMDRFK